MDTVTRTGGPRPLSQHQEADGFLLSPEETRELATASWEDRVSALIDKVEAKCEGHGGPLAPGAPERAVWSGTIVEYAMTFGIRPVDCLPMIAFTCPQCGDSAQIVDGLTWRCRKCGPGTRYTLADRILRSPDLLRTFLALTGSTSKTAGRA